MIDERRGVSTEGRELINALAGDDEIIGSRGGNQPGYFSDRGNLQLGSGDDLLIGSSGGGDGIENQGFIYMGPGNDRIEASGANLGIRNRRFIFMQDGADVVDVGEDGIRGRGFVDMGPGNNTFIGYGNHSVFATEERNGQGRDTLLLPSGRYDVRRRGRTRGGSEVRIERNDDRLRVFDFDLVGGIGSRRDQRIDIEFTGTLVVRDNGGVEIVGS